MRARWLLVGTALLAVCASIGYAESEHPTGPTLSASHLESKDAETHRIKEERRKAAAQRLHAARGRQRQAAKAKEVPYERLKDSEVRLSDGCRFKGCPADQPRLYLLTSHRNRAASYNRLLRTIAIDLHDKNTQFPGNCVCAAAADYDDVIVGPPVAAAFEDFPFDKATIHLNGSFSRAGGFQRCIDHLVTTPHNESIVFLVDADLVAFPGLIDRIIKYTKLDMWAFAPAVWSTNGNASDVYQGYWRSGGTGMISFYVSELQKFGGTLPYVSKVSWGGEDHVLTKYLEKKAMLKIKRTCTPELWHYYHSKAVWGAGPDGRHRAHSAVVTHLKDADWSDAADNAWKLPLETRDGPEVLEARGYLDDYRCRELAAGHMYPKSSHRLKQTGGPK